LFADQKKLIKKPGKGVGTFRLPEGHLQRKGVGISKQDKKWRSEKKKKIAKVTEAEPGVRSSLERVSRKKAGDCLATAALGEKRMNRRVEEV